MISLLNAKVFGLEHYFFVIFFIFSTFFAFFEFFEFSDTCCSLQTKFSSSYISPFCKRKSKTRKKQLKKRKIVFLIVCLIEPNLASTSCVWEDPFCQKKIKILAPYIYSIQYWFRTGSLETSRIHVEFNRFSIESHVWH